MLDFLKNFLILTPDFGRSDVWHFDFALKFFLSEALKNGYLPFWSKNIGTGFPLFAEGQIGMLMPVNLFLFKFFDAVTAFNLGLISIFLTVFIGSYLFGKARGLAKLSGLFLAVIFSFSGVFVTQMTHFNLIQAAAFLPWEFFAAEEFIKSNKLRYLSLFGTVLALQLYAGFPQAAMISLIGVGLYVFWRKPRAIIGIGAATMLGAALAAPQLLASWQIAQLSFRSSIPVAEMARFPFNPKSFLTFLNPYLLGDPRIGTYPPFSADWGIFWESTGYFGILPLLLIPLAFKKTPDKSILAILVTAFILMLGRFTPLFFVFQLPTLDFFRVPARFILLFVWALAVLAASGFNHLKNKGLQIFILLFSAVNLAFFAGTYHGVTLAAQSWLAPPANVQTLSRDHSWFRIYSIGAADPWNQVFYKSGWKDVAAYKPFRNFLDPNQNLYWDVPSAQFYTAVASRRQTLFDALMAAGPSTKLLSLAGVKYFIKPDSIATLSAKPHAYLTSHYEVVSDLESLVQRLTDASDSAAIVEEKVPVTPSIADCGQAQVIKNEDLEVDIKIFASRDCLLILSDSYYPGWEARIDGRPTKIYPANLNQRAILVMSGSHLVIFSFNPLKIL
ncbi:MAG: hypothetical protein M1484_03295 [Patescibacteria group bacterium]|nr:hypothetical protein [Patescibacteria group bacterium]MCL5432087.1 hypothetical protein [Patescibacteria group bacterium]